MMYCAPPTYNPVSYVILPWSCWTQVCSVFANSAGPHQLASEEGIWSESALFVIKYVNLYQQPKWRNQIGWKLEVRSRRVS